MDLRMVTICTVILIPVLIVIYIYFDFENRHLHLEQCPEGESCVRYCCANKASCSDEISIDLMNYPFAENLNKSFRHLFGEPCSIDHAFSAELASSAFLENGILKEDDSIYNWNEYCLGFNETEPEIQVCQHVKFIDRIKSTFPYFMMASIPFLIITLIVYTVTKDLRNLHGKCLISYVVSLSCMYFTLSFLLIYNHELVENYPFSCSFLGYGLLVAIFCSFMWLTVMCFDIWSTFRYGARSDNTKTFLKYCAYAFGIPMILVFFLFILNHFELIPDKYNTQIGKLSCSVHIIVDENGYTDDHKILQVLYIYGPISALICINIILYTITALKIFRVNQDAKIWRKNSECRKHSKEIEKVRFMLYLRMSVIMGIPWIIEIVSFIFGDSPILFVASILNCMQGFIVFITFVWSQKVVKLLERKYTQMSVKFRSKKLQSSDGRTIAENTEATRFNNNTTSIQA